jgi:hypothetical protein
MAWRITPILRVSSLDNFCWTLPANTVAPKRNTPYDLLSMVLTGKEPILIFLLTQTEEHSRYYQYFSILAAQGKRVPLTDKELLWLNSESIRSAMRLFSCN